MCDREHAIFTPPHDERRATIARGPRDPIVTEGLAHAAQVEALGQRPDELGERGTAVALGFRVKLGGDPRHVVVAAFEGGAGGRGRARETRERAYDRAPVLGPSADAVNEKDRIAGRTVSALFKYTSTQALDRDRARLHLWVSCSDALLLPLHRRREAAQRSVSPGCAIQGRRC